MKKTISSKVAAIVSSEINNVYHVALATRIANETTKAIMTETNIKKLQSAQAIVKNEKILSFLTDNACNADYANLNVYVIEKHANFLTNAVKLDAKFNKMSQAIFQTVINCANADSTITMKDAQDACSKDRLVSEDRKALVCQRNFVADISTVKAQSQSSISALVQLNVLKFVARDSKETHYTIDTNNSVYKALVSQLAA